ncbi:MAG TPA: murein biosynthesis integral membrane protein MurJ [Bacillota bacterium]|nr:murein biosynthesis integral membrane protein MurJ [Bacillota bacterium]
MTTGKFIFKATVMIAFFKLMSQALGVVREAVIARQFGTTVSTDAYIVALRMPNIVFYIVSGALVTAIVPVFTEYVARGRKDEAWKVFNTVVIVITLLFSVITLAGIAGSPLLVTLMAPFFEGQAEALTAELAGIILPLMIFAGLASLFTNLLNANNIFGLPAFSLSVNNIFIILSALTIGSIYGIHGLALGTVLAAAAMALIQLPALYRTGFRLKFSIELSHPGVRKVFCLAWPAAVGVAVRQANIYVSGVLASWLPEGSISALNFAERLMNFPVGLFVLALGTAAFPTLAKRAAEGNREAYSDVLAGSLKAVLAGIIPAGIGFMVLSRPIVTLVYKRGVFDEQSVSMTAAALFFYAVGLAGLAASVLLERGFYSFQDTRTPVKVGIVAVLINLVLSLLLIRPLQLGGIALATSLSSLTYAGLLMFYLERKRPVFRGSGLFRFTAAVLAASGLMAAASWGVCMATEGLTGGTAGVIAQVGLSVAAGIAVYTAALFAMGVEEARAVWRAAVEAVKGGTTRRKA